MSFCNLSSVVQLPTELSHSRNEPPHLTGALTERYIGTSHLHQAHFPYLDSLCKLRKEGSTAPPWTIPIVVGNDRGFLIKLNVSWQSQYCKIMVLVLIVRSNFFTLFSNSLPLNTPIALSKDTTLTSSIPTQHHSYSRFTSIYNLLTPLFGANGVFLSHSYVEYSYPIFDNF